MTTTHKYYEIEAFWPEDDGTLTREILFGSYDRSEVTFEKRECSAGWREDGYKKIKMISRMTTEAPDPEVYPDSLIETGKQVAHMVDTLARSGHKIEIGYYEEDIDPAFEVLSTVEAGVNTHKDIFKAVEEIHACDEIVAIVTKDGKKIGVAYILASLEDDEQVADFSADTAIDEWFEAWHSKHEETLQWLS